MSMGLQVAVHIDDDTDVTTWRDNNYPTGSIDFAGARGRVDIFLHSTDQVDNVIQKLIDLREHIAMKEEERAESELLARNEAETEAGFDSRV